MSSFHQLDATASVIRRAIFSRDILVLSAAGLLIWVASGTFLALVAGVTVVAAAAVTGASAARRRANGFGPADTLLARCSRWVPGGVALALAIVGFAVTIAYRGNGMAQLIGTALFLFHVMVISVAARPEPVRSDNRI